jgi:DNA primase catalytic core
MSIHKLTAGSGYDYLTRQVAALDATEKGHLGLASYYTERGETPGVWIGSGMASIDGLNPGDVVTTEQMRALFGAGLHPLAVERQQQLQGPDLTVQDYQAVTRLGAPFKIYQPDVSPFRVEVARRIAALNQAAGLPSDWAVPVADRARIRTEVAREFFLAEHGRPTEDARELAATIAKNSRPRTQAVAGYDLTFSPVKSVSALWAVANQSTAAAIERAHRAAIADALRFIEQHALYTRLGTNGVRQVEVRGLVAAAFTHRDSRAGDPDLHTHVAVANKVQTVDGRWLSIDGRILFKATVAASETYNTALENHLQGSLGVRFTERPNPDPRLRPVREIVGVDPALNARWSARRAAIETRRGELAADFQGIHGRPPTPVESLKLAQQATLETRDAKHQPRTLTEQKAAWLAQAGEVLGGQQAVHNMVRAALHPHPVVGTPVNARWVKDTAGRVLAAMEERRSTWQIWHVRAEAQRQVRAVELKAEQSERLVDLLVGHVLGNLSVSLALPNDGIIEPAVLQRSDGTSVYTVVGSELFTSTRILDAEQRLVAAAGRYDGRAISPAAVDVALLEASANGVTLNAGQVALVRQMATSGARLHLAIAPAGAGKTTAMRALAAAWTGAGGTVIGLAPSAAAAAQLRDQINAHTDTLAKLTWSAGQHDLPEWARRIGPSTLVVIDEAGMADTLTLDAAVEFIVGRGGSVRLVGDDQQLAAIGAGGVLRDIAHTHGAVRLTELHRFSDPAESAASLALRDGRPEALGFYLDQRRVHVGDVTALTEDVFLAWRTDRSSGLDAIMLAPTRELVSQLNQRARAHRLAAEPDSNQRDASPVAMLADGNPASVGEQVITRANNRTLRLTATDWVKNGDRWTVLKVTRGGDLTVRHHRNGRTVRLPASYVQESVELGYATTVHTAQGITADTMHGLVTGEESRQQLYTMLTRGRIANHIYLQVAGDGDPHSLIRPETIHPCTATELLEQILARDDTARSASTLQRDQQDPASRLGDAAPRYVDALHVAAEDLAGRERVEALELAAEQIVPGLTGEPAWPTLRAHLLLFAAHGADPVAQLAATACARELDSADHRAAVVDWRLDDTGHRNAGLGPLPWLPGIPTGLRAHPEWGGYLTARSELVGTLADRVRASVADTDTPEWATHHGSAVPARVLADVQVWRAAMQVSPEDRRPTGPVQLPKAARTWQRHLDRQVCGDLSPALQEWGWLIDQLSPNLTRDPFAPILAGRLAAMSRAGVDASQLLRSAITGAGPLPDDHAAAAVWWRIGRHLTSAVAAQADTGHTFTAVWSTRLVELIGADRAASLQSSLWWSALVRAVDNAMRRGWRLDDLLGAAGMPDAGSVDAAQGLVWRISLLADPTTTDEAPGEPSFSTAPLEPWNNAEPTSVEIAFGARDDITIRPADTTDAVFGVAADRDWVEPDLAVAALVRGVAGPPEQSDDDVQRMFTRAMAWRDCPITRDRMIEINQLALSYFRSRFPASWGRAYLTDRFGQDLTDDPRFRPGQAPAGWTGLINHLRSRGVTDQEMTAAGVATIASTGRLIDRFRDRVIFPIINNGEILGFVGRRHPDLTDTDRVGPKYLNTADTPLFHKGAQLFGTDEVDPAAGGVPVIAEGPMDAIAVTLASGGRYIGVAPLGTSLTDEQASQLARLGVNPIVATDADIAGRVAAERDFWILTPYRLDPLYALLPEGTDPADLLALNGPIVLTTVLDQARPLGERLITERLTNLPPDQAQYDAARVVAARSPECWHQGSSSISSRLNLPLPAVRRTLLAHVREWNLDSRRAAANPLQGVSEVKKRLTEAAAIGPEQRWAALAGQLDQRLLRQGDWPALAQLLQRVDDQGHDVAAIIRAVTRTPLTDLPAQDLRYRIVAHLDLCLDLQPSPVHTSTAKTTTRPRPHREAAASVLATTRTPPR